MSKTNTVLWKDLKFKYSPNDNYHGTCYYGALRLLLKSSFNEMFEKHFTKELIKNHSTYLNTVQPFAKYADTSKDYRFAQPDESLHDEEGVLWLTAGKNESHIVYFKNGEYYDDYMSLVIFDDPKPILIIVKTKE